MKEPVSIRRQIHSMAATFIVLSVAIFLVMLFSLIAYQCSYTNLLYNVTTASEFNQDFKESIDLKMYYYVIESSYSEGLPISEVKNAQTLAQDLINTTTQKDSLRAITSVLDLCENLETKMVQIQETGNYDEREVQLENNIYVLTSLIQEYMYNYLYSESVHLNVLHRQMIVQIASVITVLVLTTVVLIGVMTRRAARLSRSITQPIEDLSRRMEEVSGGELTPKEPVKACAEELNTLSTGMERMVGQIRTLLDETTQKQASLRKTELALLQAQINPHFLYNTMDTIIWLIEAEQNEAAEEMVANLSNYFRCSLSKGQDIISLETEERHIRSYLQIQQVRYQDILTYTIDIPCELHQIQLPKLTLQPLVENALYHGIKLKRAKGRISISGRREGEDVVLQVADNGVGMSLERLTTLRQSLKTRERVGFGLATVHERLQLCFGPGYGLSLESEEGQGTCVTARIPAHWKEVEHL